MRLSRDPCYVFFMLVSSRLGWRWCFIDDISCLLQECMSTSMMTTQITSMRTRGRTRVFFSSFDILSKKFGFSLLPTFFLVYLLFFSVFFLSISLHTSIPSLKKELQELYTWHLASPSVHWATAAEDGDQRMMCYFVQAVILLSRISIWGRAKLSPITRGNDQRRVNEHVTCKMADILFKEIGVDKGREGSLFTCVYYPPPRHLWKMFK